MLVKCSIELQGLDLDFDEDMFLEELAEMISNNEQTYFAEGVVKVQSDKVTLATYLGGEDRRVNRRKANGKRTEKL